MELHHIRQKADGGEDSYENCIPLCFDCHAEVGHYNPQHPKGRKFSEGELRLHRDRWYEKVAASPGPVVEERLAELDRNVLQNLRAILPRDENISFMGKHDYGSAFRADSHDQIRRFYHTFVGPDCEFMDADLEARRAALRAAVGEFICFLSLNTWEVNPHTKVYSVPQDWQISQAERWERTQERLNRLADEVVERYDDLIRTARLKLGVQQGPPE